jgi:phage gp29-like protein
MERIIRQALDAPQLGYQPMEVSWWGAGSGLWLSDIQAKPPEWFCFDADARLRFKTKTAPLYGVELPEYKFLLPRQDASYQNPYGLPDLALCYWPVVFMKGGKRFWLTFAEKFGGTFLVGKLPRTAQAEERRAMLDALDMLVQDGVGTIPDDGSVAPLESGSKSASSDLYEKLVMFCRSEISIAQTGTNQTMEASSTHASAKAGMSVVEDLRDADAAIVCAMVNQAIRWVVDKNYPGQAAPVFEMWDQRARDELRAARDKQLSDAGVKFTNRYWVRSYGYKEDDLQPEAGTTPPPAPAQLAGGGVASFAEPAVPAAGPDPLAADVATLTTAAAPAWATLVDQVQSVVMRAGTLAEAQQALLAAYGHLPTDELTRLMAAAFALAELKGMAAALDAGA